MTPPYRIVASWANGAYVNTLSPDFQKEFNELVAQFGLPDAVEVKGDDEWAKTDD